MRRFTMVGSAAAVSLVAGFVLAPAAPAAGGVVSAGVVSGGAVPAAPWGPVAVRAAAEKPLVVKGKVTGAGTQAAVLLVAADGTSVSASVGSTGAFSVRVTNAAIRSALAPGRRGTGAAVQLIRSGDYAGPFVLRSVKRKGYGRLSPTLSGTVNLGTFVVTEPGYVAARKAVKEALVDTAHPMRLVNGVPAGAGRQGATRSTADSGPRSRTVVPAGELPPDAAGLGQDADTDGVPNVADVDMNDDGVLDAAQADAALPTEGGGTLSGDQVLANRPVTAIQFGKILNADNSGSVNTNITPNPSWENLQGYLAANSHIETVIARGDIQQLLCPPGTPPDTLCDQARSLSRVTMDCRTQAYCQPGTSAVIVAPPGTGLDGQPLSVLINAQGLIEMPLDAHVQTPGLLPAEQGFQLNFSPNLSGPAMLLVGDSFEYVFHDAQGNELARQVKVLTSSVSAPPEVLSMAGTTLVRPLDDRTPLTITQAQASAVDVRFTRPQRLDAAQADAAAPVLIDRAGMEYSVYLMGQGSPGSGSSFFWCRGEQVVPVAGGPLVTVTRQYQPPGRDKVMFDGAVDPPNGETLGFTIDLTACLANPGMFNGTYTPGETLRLEIEGVDADFNRTRTTIPLVIG